MKDETKAGCTGPFSDAKDCPVHRADTVAHPKAASEWESTFWLQKEFKVDYPQAMALLTFIRQQIAAARDDEASKCYEHEKKAREEERERILAVLDGYFKGLISAPDAQATYQNLRSLLKD